MHCLDTRDYENERVVFDEDNRKKHALKHPELDDQGYINGRLQQAIKKPDFVYQALDDPTNKRVHYLHEYSNNGRSIYTKVIIMLRRNCNYVVTAWRIDYVKEKGKTKLIYGAHV